MQDSNRKVVLLGYSGHGFVVAEALLQQGFELIGYADSCKRENNPYSIPFLGDEKNVDFEWSSEVLYALGVGNNEIREGLAERVRSNGGRLVSIIHPEASISRDLQLGNGSFIARNATVNPLVEVGSNVILNTSCVIDHECIIEDNVHIAPGAVLAGNVKVGKSAFIGANCVVKEGVIIGERSIIGAGSVIIANVDAATIVVGNPGKNIR